MPKGQRLKGGRSQKVVGLPSEAIASRFFNNITPEPVKELKS